jgi:hypothetical protein
LPAAKLRTSLDRSGARITNADGAISDCWPTQSFAMPISAFSKKIDVVD